MSILYHETTPGLGFDQQFGRWALSLPRSLRVPEDDYDGTDQSFVMMIDVDWNGLSWFSYRFIEWQDGDWFELYTQEQYNERVQAIRDNEGDEVAELWVDGQEQVKVVADDHPVFDLRQHWEAMMQLKLFWPGVTHKAWQGKPLSDDLRKKMDEARQRDLIASAAEAIEQFGEDELEKFAAGQV